MINIIRQTDELFQVNVNDVSTEPLDMKSLFLFMRELEVEFDEVDMAVTELIHKDHRYANFGVNGKFIFTK